MNNKTAGSIFRELFLRIIYAIFNRENLLALLLALLVIAIYLATASESPLWVYQGF